MAVLIRLLIETEIKLFVGIMYKEKNICKENHFYEK